MRRIVLCSLFLSALAASGAPAPAPRRERPGLAQLQGEWVIARSINLRRDGIEIEERKGEFSLVIEQRIFRTWLASGEESSVSGGTIVIDTSTEPKRLDLVHRYPADQDGVTLVGIYRLENDTLTWLFARPEDGRPTDFSDFSGNLKHGQSGMVLRRKGSRP